MTLTELRAKREMILAIAKQHGAKNLRVFGSVAKGTARSDSDVDLLVDVGEEHSAFFPGGLIVDLEDLLGCKVDVVEPAAIHWYIKKKILNESVPL